MLRKEKDEKKKISMRYYAVSFLRSESILLNLNPGLQCAEQIKERNSGNKVQHGRRMECH